jgi:hypothetical protein
MIHAPLSRAGLFKPSIALNLFQSNQSDGYGCPLFCFWELSYYHTKFTEWTPDGHLRHSRFVGLRDDNGARDAVREG